MMSNSVSEKYFSGILWVFIDKAGNGGINFIITIVLARLLTPEDFGLVAMVMIFFELSSTFIESGFSTALIRMKTISEEDKSTTFVFNFVASLFLYAILYFTAPLIAQFFNQPILVAIVRIMGLNLIVGSFAIIQRADLSHQIDFRTQTKVRLFSVIIAGIAAVTLALLNFGVWSLVVKFALTTLFYSILLCYFNRWTPNFNFNLESFKKLFGFGSKILITAFINKFFVHIYNVLIGKFFTASTLGLYSQANHFKNLVIFTLFHTIDRVSYVALSKMKEDKSRLKQGYRKILKMTSFIIMPVLVVLAVLAKPFILTLIGPKWLDAVPFLQLLCISGLTYHFSQINLNILLVIGRPDLNLRLELYKKVMISVGIAIGLQYGIYGLLISEIVTAYIALIMNAYYSKKFLDYHFLEQVKDIYVTTLFSLASGLVVFLALQNLAMNTAQLIVGVLVGSLSYVGLHFFFKSEEINMVRKVVIPQTLKLIGSRYH